MARSSDAAFPLSLVRDKTFQMRQVRRVLLLTVFFIAQSTIVLGVFYHYFLGSLVEGTAPLLFASEDLAAFSEQIPNLSTVLGKWLLVMLLINALVTTAIAVYVLRKLSNPILAIKRALNEIGSGNLSVRLRTGDSDEFSELCDALNRALEQIHERISSARELTRVIEQLEDQPEPDDAAVRKALNECREVLSYFDKLPTNLTAESRSNDRNA